MYRIIKAMEHKENKNYMLIIENNKGEKFITTGVAKWELTSEKLNKCIDIPMQEEKTIKVVEKFKQYFNQDIEKINSFNIESIDIYTKGYLKGYANGYISFTNKPDTNHEFLYRYDDKDNGENFKLVSIDYGYKNSLVTEIWEEIENHLYYLIQEKFIG